MRIPQKYIDDLKNGKNEQVEFKVKFSNQYIASVVKVTSNRVSKIISSLKNKKYIQVNLKYKKKVKK